MAQTTYDARSALAYANALANQGSNPILDWFTNAQGGGLANWLDNQGKQISKRRKDELAYKIEHDENLVDKVRDFQNQGKDLRKDLLQGYFIDPADETLNTAVDTLNTKAINRLNTDISNAVTEKINQDVYKGGSILDEAKALGWNKLSKEHQQQLKEFEEKALKSRYEEGLFKEIATRRLTDPNYDPTQLVHATNQKYGMNLNPAEYLDPTSEKAKKYQESAFNQVLQDSLKSDSTYSDTKKNVQALVAYNPRLADQATYAMSWLDSQDKKEKQEALNELYQIGVSKGYDSKKLISTVINFSRKNGWNDEYALDILKRNNAFSDATSNIYLGGVKRQTLAATSALQAYEQKLQKINENLKKTVEDTREYGTSKETAEFLQDDATASYLLNNAGLSSDILKRQFIDYVKLTDESFLDNKQLKKLFKNTNSLKEKIEEFKNERTKHSKLVRDVQVSKAAEDFVQMLMYNIPVEMLSGKIGEVSNE